ncbi:MAG: hypothetical protein AELANPGJ_03600 [Anaerolineae bacterium]|nr:hypothetical protein [Anaerolineae bacterium]
MAKTAQQIVQKYERGMQGAGENYRQGIQNPSRDWAQGLQNSKQKMITGFQQAMSDGKFDAGVQRTGTAGWKQKTLDKAGNYSGAVQRAVAGYQAQAQNIAAVSAEVSQTVNAMPNATLDQRLERMRANALGIREAWNRRR